MPEQGFRDMLIKPKYKRALYNVGRSRYSRFKEKKLVTVHILLAKIFDFEN